MKTLYDIKITQHLRIVLSLTIFLFFSMLIFSSTSNSKVVGDSFSDLVEALSPSVVNITSTTLVTERPNFNPTIPRGSPFEDFFREFQNPNDSDKGPKTRRRGSALGSGFIISSDGFVVTNNHVIENADEIEIEMLDGTTLQAEVYGRDARTDIALLKVKTKKDLPFVQFGDSNTSRVGDWVLAIGNPLGQGFSVSAGIISARGRALSGSYDDFIQTDAAINRGNSGGPLFNMNGEVIGVNTAILSPNGGSIGIGFSMSSSVVEKVVNQLKNFGETRRGWLGVRIQDVTEDVAEALNISTGSGALVTDVPEGPAKEAGIISGDLIKNFDGTLIDSTRTLVRVVADSEIGKKVEVEILRDNKNMIIIVELGRLEDALANLEDTPNSQKNKEKIDLVLGMKLSELTQEIKKNNKLNEKLEGVYVNEVNTDSDAFEKGLRSGDVILKIGQEKVYTPSDVKGAVNKVSKMGRSSVLLLISRDGNRRFFAISIKEKK